ncbi:hypothetical protein Tco_1505937 [Tanacetum coccineum]
MKSKQESEFEWKDQKTMLRIGKNVAWWSNIVGELVGEFLMHYSSWDNIEDVKKAYIKGRLMATDPSMLTEFISMASYHLCKVIESLALQYSFDSAVKLPRIILYLLVAATVLDYDIFFCVYAIVSVDAAMVVQILVTWMSCLKATRFEPVGHSFHDVALKLVGCFMEEKVEDDDEISYSLPKDKEPDYMHPSFRSIGGSSIVVGQLELILHRRNQELIREISTPSSGSKDLVFLTQYAPPFACTMQSLFVETTLVLLEKPTI